MSKTVLIIIFAVTAIVLSCSDKGPFDHPSERDLDMAAMSSSSEGGSSSQGEQSSSSAEQSSSSSSSVEQSSSSELCEETYNKETHFCYGTTVYPKCGGSTYLGDRDACCNNIVYNKRTHHCDANGTHSCGGLPLDESTHFCNNNKLYPLCVGSQYTTTKEFCLDDKITDLCDGREFEINEFCYDGSEVRSKCGGTLPYSPGEACCGNDKYTVSSQFCYNESEVKNKCGGEDYDPLEVFCLGNVKTPFCGGYQQFYNYQFCHDGEVKDKCGGSQYNPGLQYDPVTEDCCGNSKYTVSERFCVGTTLYDKCNGENFDPSEMFCLDNVKTALCDSEKYTSNQFCNNHIVWPKCHWAEYDPSEYRCCKDILYDLETKDCCFDGYYDLLSQFCSENKNMRYNKCENSTYEPETDYCLEGTITKYGVLTDNRDYKNYKTVIINSQTWMAENLNFDITGSICGGYSGSDGYGNNRCATFGRLYNWENAKIACPSGWHIPSSDEWGVLISYVGNSSATELKSVGGWGYNTTTYFSYGGTDDYGFSALPSSYNVPTNSESWVQGGNGRWWTATEYDVLNAIHREITEYSTSFSSSNSLKTNRYAVRCVKNPP